MLPIARCRLVAATFLASLLAVTATAAVSNAADRPAGVETDPASGELTKTLFLDDGRVRAVLHVAPDFSADRPTLLLVFALPNGNTIEQTIGCRPAPGLDWRFDIQHAGAQVRRCRELDRTRNLVVAYVEAAGLSWPAWRANRADAPAQAGAILDTLCRAVPGPPPAVCLAAHSGGGALLFSLLDAGDDVLAGVERIVFLDANYSFDAGKGHGRKLVEWLNGGAGRHLVVVAYDDRNITLDGKKVVADTGGTWRATHRMTDAMAEPLRLVRTEAAPLIRFDGAGGRARFLLHANPETQILHTRLVELNGVIEGLTAGTPAEGRWGGAFFCGRAYGPLIQLVPSVPARRPDAAGGKVLADRLGKLRLPQRESAIVAELMRGNFPPSFRQPVGVRLTATIDGKPHECVIDVMPDHLSVGSDADRLRVPLTPAAAVKVAAALGCTLPTRKMVDAIDAGATVRLEPRPMTDRREAFATFVEHDAIVEAQRAGRAGLVTGGKKDVVLSNRLTEWPDRVAIYGWRQPDGTPIQPLSTVHAAGYVDYSHGLRLVSRVVRVDGERRLIEDVLKDPKLHVLLSDEGPVEAPAAFYR